VILIPCQSVPHAVYPHSQSRWIGEHVSGRRWKQRVHGPRKNAGRMINGWNVIKDVVED
jgi:hypothetical protein